MPVSQMRVRGKMNLPMKDNLTLAFYNTPDGAILELTNKIKWARKRKGWSVFSRI